MNYLNQSSREYCSSLMEFNIYFCSRESHNIMYKTCLKTLGVHSREKCLHVWY